MGVNPTARLIVILDVKVIARIAAMVVVTVIALGSVKENVLMLAQEGVTSIACLNVVIPVTMYVLALV